MLAIYKQELNEELIRLRLFGGSEPAEQSGWIRRQGGVGGTRRRGLRDQRRDEREEVMREWETEEARGSDQGERQGGRKDRGEAYPGQGQEERDEGSAARGRGQRSGEP